MWTPEDVTPVFVAKTKERQEYEKDLVPQMIMVYKDELLKRFPDDQANIEARMAQIESK